MVDIFTSQERSKIMKKIGSKNTSIELQIKGIVSSLRYKYKLYGKNLPGSPDIIFPNIKKAIFVHGCFWHGHLKCKRGHLPQTNKSFWKKKIYGNIKRDLKVRKGLRKIGWNSLIIWQCQIKKKNILKLKEKVRGFLQERVKTTG